MIEEKKGSSKKSWAVRGIDPEAKLEDDHPHGIRPAFVRGPQRNRFSSTRPPRQEETKTKEEVNRDQGDIGEARVLAHLREGDRGVQFEPVVENEFPACSPIFHL